MFCLQRSLRARELHVTAMEQLLGGDTEACSEEELDALDFVTGPSSAAAAEDDGADDEPGPSEVQVRAGWGVPAHESCAAAVLLAVYCCGLRLRLVLCFHSRAQLSCTVLILRHPC